MIEINNLTVKYGKKTVYDGFNLNVEDGKITCLLGESGCGKTTLLNAVAELIDYGGRVSPVRVSYIFQSPRLIPYINVLKNLTAAGAEEKAAHKMLERVGLGEKAGAYPDFLSGGEAQRVSLCRALLVGSDALLADEPFSSLDLKTKLSVMELFKELQREDGRCVLFVTHDVDEAVFMSDRIIVTAEGKILKDFENIPSVGFGESNSLRGEIISALLNK